MAFRDDVQRVRVCRALCKRAKPDLELWTDKGPTDEASKLVEQGTAWSRSERLLFLLAWDIWESTSHSRVTVAECLQALDRPTLEAVGSLLVALAKAGSEEDPTRQGIEQWLERHGA